jgi:hypothetical protein
MWYFASRRISMNKLTRALWGNMKQKWCVRHTPGKGSQYHEYSHCAL